VLDLYPFTHAFDHNTFLVILTGLASGQGMALFQPSSPYVEAVLVMGLSTIAPCGSLHWLITARRFVLAAAHKPHPAYVCWVLHGFVSMPKTLHLTEV
jgi:hypothetical protein